MEFPDVIPTTTLAAPPSLTVRAGTGSENTFRAGTYLVIIAFLVSTFSCLLAAGPAQAATVFPGGSCSLITQANGIRLDFCTNLTGKTVDDIHVTFTHPGLPPALVDYGQSLGCDLFGIGNCFGPAVAPNGNWNGIAGGLGPTSNVTLWGAGDLIGVDFNFDRVKATGYWTKGGVAVPEPTTWALLIAGFGLVGAALRSRRRRAGAALPHVS